MDLFEKALKYCATTTQLYQDFMILSQRGGQGCWIWGQIRGQEPRLFMDFASGIGVNDFGYGGETVPALAVQKQASSGVLHAAHNDWYVDSAILLAERLALAAPGSSDKKVFFCSSGTEAVNAAVKLAYVAGRGKRRGLLAFDRGAFHGRIGYSLDLTYSKEVQREFFVMGDHPISRLTFPDISDPNYHFTWWLNAATFTLETCTLPGKTALPTEIAAGVFELIRGEGGIQVADPLAIRFLHDYLGKKGIPFIVDEVQTGIDRTGKLFASEHYGIEPDVICLAKALGGGVPIGAIVFRADLDFDKQGRHSNTFGGNPLAASAALAVLDEMTKPEFLKMVEARAEYLGGALEVAAGNLNKNPFGIRVTPGGLGLMRKLEFRDKDGKPQKELRDRVNRNCLEDGLIVLPAGDSAVRFLPPLVISEEEIDHCLGVVIAAARRAFYSWVRDMSAEELS